MISKSRMFCIALVASGAAALSLAENAWVEISGDGTRVDVQADGFTEMKASSSVVYQMDGKSHRLGTRGQGLVAPVREKTGSTPFGDATVTVATYGASDSPFQYTLTLKRLMHLKAFTVQGVFHNRSDRDVNLSHFDLFDMHKGQGQGIVVDNPSEWLVTPLMQALPVESLDVATKGFKDAAMIYRADGKGFLAGAVGPAEAHALVEVREGTVKAAVLMEGVLVPAGTSRRSEEMILSFESPTTSMDIWTRWVGMTHGVRLNRPPVYGWCSWYDLTTNIDAEHFFDVTKTIAENPNTFGKGLIQIDDGFQKMDGDWSGNAKFPKGLAHLAQEVKMANGIPAIWFAPLMMHPEHPWGKENPEAIQSDAKGIANFMNPNPFHPAGANWIRPDHPKSKAFLFDIIRTARDNGYEYIKIDFNGIGSQYLDPTKTSLQIMRDLYTLYREAAGEDMYILSCLGQPTRGVIGFIEAARVGPDSHPAGFAHCLESILRFQQFHDVWWKNDPDVSYMGAKVPGRTLGPTPQGEGMWRTWHNVVTLVGGAAMISEPVNKPETKPQWRNYEIMRPSSRENSRLLNLGTEKHPSILGFNAERPYGDFSVYNLYNSTEGTKALTLNFSEAGLLPGVEYLVFDFWQNKVIGRVKDSYTTIPLEFLSSALLRFTPLEAEGAHPILVGSNLHLSIGATEIDGLRVSSFGIEVEFNSEAGAQEGALMFYSTKALAAAGSENCEVSSVDDLGDDLWKVNVSGRQWGKPQTIRLRVQP